MSIEPAITALFAPETMPDAETMAKYQAAYSAFGPEWVQARTALIDAWRYADSMAAAGLLEKRTIPIIRNGRDAGQTLWYRRT